MILDCCHAAGVARGLQFRSCDDSLLPPLLPDYDSTLYDRSSSSQIQTRNAQAFNGFCSPPVLLAACQRRQFAADTPNGGLFTIALIEQLEKLDIRQVDYETLIRSLGSLSKSVD